MLMNRCKLTSSSALNEMLQRSFGGCILTWLIAFDAYELSSKSLSSSVGESSRHSKSGSSLSVEYQPMPLVLAFLLSPEWLASVLCSSID